MQINSKAALNFLTKKGANQNETTIEDVFNYSRSELENDHCFIQWCFPTNEPSKHAQAPVVSYEDVKNWYEDTETEEIVKENVRKIYERMLSFYGFYRNSNGKLVNDKHPFTINFGWDHNRLRITRMLKSLEMLGLKNEATEFYEALMKIYKAYPWRFDKDSVKYWQAAMSDIQKV